MEVKLLTDEELNDLSRAVTQEINDRKVLAEAVADAELVSLRFLTARDRRAGSPDSNSAPPVWVAPTGAHDVYPKNYIVLHNDKIWVNRHHANSWEPGTTNSQWTDITTPPVDPETGIPNIIPWGVGQFVTIGTKRTHNGWVWEALVEHDTHIGWEPSEATYAVWKNIGPDVTAEPPEPEPEEPEPDPEPPEPDPEPPGEPEEPPVEEPTIEPWAEGQNVSVGDLRTHDGIIWRAKLAHTTHSGWAPSAATHAVWENIGPA